MIDIVLGVIRTWAHILVGVGILIFVVISAALLHKWYIGVVDGLRRISDDR